MKTACELLVGWLWLSLISGCSSGQDSSTDVPFIAPFTGVGVLEKPRLCGYRRPSFHQRYCVGELCGPVTQRSLLPQHRQPELELPPRLENSQDMK